MPKDHYTVLCACGSSIATSTLMASRLVDLFKQNNMDVSIKKTSYADLDKDIKFLFIIFNMILVRIWYL
jgi:galactitol-specific phosphotransferase system IIB component